MATPYRGYSEIPGSAVPDVPYRVNLALREIDADVHDVDDASRARDLAAEGRLGNLEQAAGFPNDPVATTDANVAGAIGTAGSLSEAKVRALIRKDAFPLTELEILRARLGSRDKALVNVVFAGSSTINTGGASTPDKSITYLTARQIYAAFPKVDGTQHYTPVTLATAAASTVTAAGIRAVNAGVGGTTSANYLTATTRPQVVNLAPAAIFHMVGSNDYANQTPVATYKANLETQLAGLSALSNTVHIFLHAFERQDVTSPAIKWSQYGDALRELADSRGDAVFIDLSQSFAEMGLPGTDTYDLIGTDRMHATDAGHAVMASSIKDALTLVPAAQDTGWVTLAPKAGYAHRASQTLQYRVKDGVINYRGGIVNAAGGNLATGYQQVATHAVAGLGPGVQNTELGAAGVGLMSMRYAEAAAVASLAIWPSAAYAYVMFGGMSYPLEELAS